MHAVVTGGAGYIGSFLVAALLKKNHRVTVIDSFSNSEKLGRFRKEFGKRVPVIQGDIATAQVPAADWLFHLAGKSGGPASKKDPALFHHANVDGTIHILEEARKNGVGKIIYAASTSCYEMNSPYALTKYLGEQYVLHWGNVYKMHTVSLRLAAVYGPKSPITGTYGYVTGLREEWMRTKTVSRPNESRNLVSVDSVVQAFLRAAREKTHPRVSDVLGKTMRFADVPVLLFKKESI